MNSVGPSKRSSNSPGAPAFLPASGQWLLIAASLLLGLACPQAQATLLSDDFKSSGGTGWSGGWNSSSGWTHFNSGSSSLTYTQGGYAIAQASGSGIFYANYTSYRGGYRLAAAPLTNVVWFSALLVASNTTSEVYVGFNTINTSNSGTYYNGNPSSAYNIGISNTTLLAGFGNNGGSLANVLVTTNSTLAAGTVHLVLGRVTLQAGSSNDKLELWADPADLTHLGAPQWQSTAFDTGTNLFNVTVGTVNSGAVDALRFSDGNGNASQAFTDVTGTTNLGLYPTIDVNPQPQVVAAGSNATLSVVASGAGLVYQWYRNGTTVLPCATGTTSSTLLLTNVTTACRGEYSVSVSNALGVVVSVPVSVQVTTGTAELVLVNYSTNQPVYAAGVPVDAQSLWTEMGVGNATPVRVRTVDGGTNVAVSLGTNGGRQVVWVYTSLGTATRVRLLVEPTNQWPTVTNLFVASADPLGTNVLLRNGVLQMGFASGGWTLGFSPAGQTNSSLMIQNGTVDFWLDYTNRGRLSTTMPLLDMGLLTWSNSTAPTYAASFGADGRPTITRSRQMAGFASAVTFIEDFQLVPGMPLLICQVRWQNSGGTPIWLAYVNNGGGIRGKWGTALMASPLVLYQADPFSGALGGGSPRMAFSSLCLCTLDSQPTGCSVGLSTILKNYFYTNNNGLGSMVWDCGTSGFGCNLADPLVGQFPFYVPPNSTYTNGIAFVLTQTGTGCWRQTTNVYAALPPGNYPAIQPPCAVFMDGAALLPQCVPGLRGTNVLSLLEPSPNGFLHAALRMEFTNQYICRISAQLSGAEDSVAVQVRRMGAGAPPIPLLAISQSGTYEVDMNQVLGWSTDTRFTLEVLATGAAAVTQLAIVEVPPAPPVLMAPLQNQSVTDFAVSYRWASSGPSIFDYELQISQRADFATNQLVSFTCSDAEPTWEPPDNNLPPAGACYWRVRARKGTAVGNWSSTGAFMVDTTHPLMPLKRPVTAENPAFYIDCTRTKIFTNFNPNFPADIRPFCPLMLWLAGGPITNALAGIGELPYQVVISRGGSSGSTSSGPSLPELEWACQSLTNLIGFCGGEGLSGLYASDPYQRRLAMLCAKYGLWYHEADGIYYSDKWYALMHQQGSFMTNYGHHILLSEKNNIIVGQFYSHSAALGLWLSDVTHMNGAWNDGEFYWNNAGFGTLGTCYGERKGVYGTMPDNFWNLANLRGLANGAALFYLGGDASSQGYGWQRYLLPLVRAVVQHGLIPTKTQVQQKIKLAVYADLDNRATNTAAYSYYGAYGPLFETAYGFETMSGIYGELWEYLPNTGRYGYIPVLPQGNVAWPAGVNITNVALSQLQNTQAVAQLFHAAYPTNWYNGDALVSLVGDTFTAINTWENMDFPQTYDMPLHHGPFSRIGGTIEVYSYLVGKRKGTAGDELLWLQADAELTNRPVVLSVSSVLPPACQVVPASAATSVQWSNSSLNLTLSTAPGTVQVFLRATHSLTVNSGAGSGIYTNGALVNIAANPAPPGQVFAGWVINSGSPSIANAGATNTTLTVPPGDAMVTAAYRPATSAPPRLSSVTLSGTNLVMVWSGPTNANAVLLTTTNVAASRASWMPAATNQGSANGLLTNIVPINLTEPRRFFLLSVP